jgi:DNA-binding NtrC family response regulator/predicted TIM-barrel enzyme
MFCGFYVIIILNRRRAKWLFDCILVGRGIHLAHVNGNPLRGLFERSLLSTQRLMAVVAGSGQVVRCACEAGADFLLVLNAGTYRNQGVGSLASFLAFGNANDQTMSLLRQHVLPSNRGLPIVAGVMAGDPTQPLEKCFGQLEQLGVAGVTNWPAVGFVDGSMRCALEAAGVGVAGEVQMIAAAARRGFATLGFALDPTAAREFAAAGAHCLILNLGLTREVEDIHERRDQLQRTLVRLREMQAAARSTGRHPFMVAYGGPATTAGDLDQILRHTDIHGYAGGSVFDRLPVRESVMATISQFKSAAMRPVAPDGGLGLGEMIGSSPSMQRTFELIKRVAPHDVNIVIEGESGTGKELVASLLHRLSPRGPQAFVTLNCGAIAESLLESELFGHEKGSFTGAHRRRMGKFELAHRGTLFLDEVADLSAHAQVSLLRALQQREITRVGGEESISVDVRILSASHQNLAERVRAGRFRADLFYRLSGMTIAVPPLRERPEDIPLLAEATLQRLCVQWNLAPRRMSANFLHRLSRYAWPGNVRELQHVVGQALLLEDARRIEGKHFQFGARTAKGAQAPVEAKPGTSKSEAAHQALAQAQGNKSRAAAALGVTRRTLYAWLRASRT